MAKKVQSGKVRNGLPKSMSYGAFRQSERFSDLFENFDDRQRQAANMFTDEVFRWCDGRGEFPAVEYIVDLGCGDGSLMAYITDQWKKKQHRPPNLQGIYGFDTCREMVALAKRTNAYNAVTHLRWDCSRCVGHPQPECSKCIDELAGNLNKANVDLTKTALCCLGHTWFHLHDGAVRVLLERLRPVLVVIDIYETWDQTIEDLEAASGHYYNPNLSRTGASRDCCDEDIRLAKGTLYCLRTRRGVDRGASSVERGIWNLSGSDWLFSTRQYFRKSGLPERLLTRSIKSSNSAEDAKATLDGWKTVGLSGSFEYLTLREFRHTSGWGPMRTFVLLSRDPIAAKLNHYVVAAVGRLVDRMFVGESNRSERAEFGADDESSNGLSLLMELFPHREVALFGPFDRNRTYARFRCIDPRVPTKRRSALNEMCNDIDFVLEVPNRWQRRLPSAFGLYQTVLAPVSSPVGLLLSDVFDHELSEADSAFLSIEREILGMPKEMAKSNRPVFLIVPFYFGTFPLFALVLEQPEGMPTHLTSTQVYYALAQNLDRQLHIALGDRDLARLVLRPLVESCFHDETASVECLEALREAIGVGKERGQGWVLEERPWKSWIHALPGRELRSLVGAATRFNNSLASSLEEELARVQTDMINRLALTLAKVKFFEDATGAEAHSKFIPKVHGERIWALAGELELELNKLDRRAYRESFVADQREALRAAGTSVGEDEFRWLDFLVMGLRALRPDLASDEATGAEECNGWFTALKAVFCRRDANKSDGFRFSMLRCAVLFSVALRASRWRFVAPKQVLKWKQWEENAKGCDHALHTRLIPDEPTGQVTALLSSWGHLCEVTGVKRSNFRLVLSPEFPNDRGAVELALTCDFATAIGSRGNTTDRVKEHIRALRAAIDVGCVPDLARRIQLSLKLECGPTASPVLSGKIL